MNHTGMGLTERVLAVRPGELPAVAASSGYFFFILCAYYVLRPVRDEAGVIGGVDNLAYLFTATLAGMLLLHPFYAALVSRLPRRRFIALAYRFFIANLVALWVALDVADGDQRVWVGRFFFVWLSVFNLFVVSVFWSFMSDLYRPGQGKRLFGIVGVGGTLGAVCGSALAAVLVVPLGTAALLLVSAVLLELAVRVARLLEGQRARLSEAAREDPASTRVPEDAQAGEGLIGGGVADGIARVIASPYLLGIAALMLLFTVSSTFLYFQRIDIVARALADVPQARVRLFAGMDLATNLLTLVTQVLLTGRLLRRLGLAFGLAFLPVLSLVGFGVLAAAPVLAVVVVFEVLRRAGNFALARPAREVLYTVLSRADKYKAKNFNDTFVYRLGDQVGSWSYTAMAWLGLGLPALAACMLPLSAAWIGLALWLARRQESMPDEA